MVQAAFAAISSLFTGGAAAGGAGAAFGATSGALAAGTTGATAGIAASSGISISSILSGAASVLGVVNAISAGNAQSDALKAQAADTEREIPLDTLQGIQTRTSIKAKLAEALGRQDAAYAASGTDLSFGTASVARSQAFREEDNALTNQGSTELTNDARLDERSAEYLKSAARAKSAGLFDAFAIGAKGVTSILNRG